MVEVVARARWFAKGAARGTGGTGSTFFEDRSGSQARLGRRSFASGEPAGSTYLRDGLLVLGVVAAGLLLGRRGTRGGASPSPSSDASGTRADTIGRTTPDSAGVPPGPTSGPAQGPADSPGVEAPALHRPAPQDAVPPTPPSLDEPPRPDDPAGRPDDDLDRAPVEVVPPGQSSGTPAGEVAATAGEQHASQEAEPPTEETPDIIDELPPPPQVSEVELPPPPSAPDVAEELPPPPPAEEAPSILEELPPPPEVGEAELTPPPAAPQNIIDELPPPPVPEEQNVGEVTSAPPEAELAEEPVAEPPREEEPQSRRRVTATAAARRRAEELGIDLLEVEGTGRNGKITADDVRRKGEQTRS